MKRGSTLSPLACSYSLLGSAAILSRAAAEPSPHSTPERACVRPTGIASKAVRLTAAQPQPDAIKSTHLPQPLRILVSAWPRPLVQSYTVLFIICSDTLRP